MYVDARLDMATATATIAKAAAGAKATAKAVWSAQPVSSTMANQSFRTIYFSFLIWIFQTIGDENSDQWSVSSGIERYVDQLQCNQREKQLIELSLKSLV